jgi:hypothetical protein
LKIPSNPDGGEKLSFVNFFHLWSADSAASAFRARRMSDWPDRVVDAVDAKCRSPLGP